MRGLLETITNNWVLKLTALGLAFLLWSALKAEAPLQTTIPDVPVTVVNRDPEWVAQTPEPGTVDVVVSGPARELLRLSYDRPEVVVSIDKVADSVEVPVLKTSWVRFGSNADNTRAEDIRPATVRLVFDRVRSAMVPLAPRFTGKVGAGLELAGPVRVEPPEVRASGAAGRLAKLDSVRLPPIDLSQFTATDTQIVAIDTTGLGLSFTPRQVRLIILIRPAFSPPDTVRRDTTRGSRQGPASGRGSGLAGKSPSARG